MVPREVSQDGSAEIPSVDTEFADGVNVGSPDRRHLDWFANSDWRPDSICFDGQINPGPLSSRNHRPSLWGIDVADRRTPFRRHALSLWTQVFRAPRGFLG